MNPDDALVIIYKSKSLQLFHVIMKYQPHQNSNQTSHVADESPHAPVTKEAPSSKTIGVILHNSSRPVICDPRRREEEGQGKGINSQVDVVYPRLPANHDDVLSVADTPRYGSPARSGIVRANFALSHVLCKMCKPHAAVLSSADENARSGFGGIARWLRAR